MDSVPRMKAVQTDKDRGTASLAPLMRESVFQTAFQHLFLRLHTEKLHTFVECNGLQTDSQLTPQPNRQGSTATGK